ncbi:MAG: exosortase/archaeosortase family protein [Candidatus Thermoplasmatota archaeon]|nr:exosortase/archaeosortase family protein [Candidatus Thermoplasmatota archaeon]
MKIKQIKDKISHSQIAVNAKKLQEKIHTFESKSIYLTFAINITSIAAVLGIFVTIYVLLTPSPNSLYPIQVFEARIVYIIQKALGFPVEIKNNIDLYYYSSAFKRGELGMEISTACTGMYEIVFLSALMIGSRGANLKTKFKWICIFAVFLFAENLVRLIMLYPIALWIGEDGMWVSHYYFWKYGHLTIILILFGLWFVFVVWKKEILCKDDKISS